MWPELVIATRNQHWVQAKSVAGLCGLMGQQYQELHRASVSRVGTLGQVGISRRQIEGQGTSVDVTLHRSICRISENAKTLQFAFLEGLRAKPHFPSK